MSTKGAFGCKAHDGKYELSQADLSIAANKQYHYKFCCHTDCFYHTSATYSGDGKTNKPKNGCDYILIAGHMRGCKPGKDCTCYEPGKREKHICPMPPKPEPIGPKTFRAKNFSEVDYEAIARCYEAGASINEICESVHCGRASVSRWLKEQHKEPHKKYLKRAEPRQHELDKPENFEKIMEYYHQEMSDKKIGQLMGCSECVVRRFRKRHNLLPSGAKTGRPKKEE